MARRHIAITSLDSLRSLICSDSAQLDIDRFKPCAQLLLLPENRSAGAIEALAASADKLRHGERGLRLRPGRRFGGG